MRKATLRKIELATITEEENLPSPAHEPIVIDFTQWRKPRRRFELSASHKIALLIVLLVVIAAAGMSYLYLERPLPPSASTPPHLHVPPPDAYFIRSEPAPGVHLAAAPPPPPEPSLPPLPNEALVEKTIRLLPILKRLPVAQDFQGVNSTPRAAARFSISLDRDQKQAQAGKLGDEAAEEVSAGRYDSAIQRYSEALRLDPHNRDTAYNLAALLLQKASYLDTQQQWNAAAASYQKALGIWGQDDDMGRAIRARLDWVKQKLVTR